MAASAYESYYASGRKYPITKPVRATEPTFEQEPLGIAEAKLQCGIAADSDYHEPLLRNWIISARQQVEHDAGVVCYTGSFTWKLTDFPCDDFHELPSGSYPVTAVSSITYIDTSGTTQTWSAANYAFESSAIHPYVRLVYGQVWPVVRGDTNGITITYVAGYSSVQLIPQNIKDAVRLALHIKWLNYTENSQEAMRQEQAYDRQIELLRREHYS